MNTLHSVFNWTLDVSLRASLLAGTVLLIQTALRGRISARWRYALWLPVLFVLVVPVLPESRWSVENVFVVPAMEANAQDSEVMPVDSVALPNASSIATPVAEAVNWSLVIAIVWAAGVLVCIVVGACSYLRSMRRFNGAAMEPDAALLRTVHEMSGQLKLRRAPRVIVSGAVESPAVAGVLRPVLLLPADFHAAFTANEARLVLMHAASARSCFDSGEKRARLLTAAEFEELMREVAVIDAAKTVSWPRMVTQDGREAQVRSVVNQPLGIGGKIEYLPAGMVCKLTPAITGRGITIDSDLDFSELNKRSQRQLKTATTMAEAAAMLTRVKRQEKLSFKPGQTALIGLRWPVDEKNKKQRLQLVTITPSVVDPKAVAGEGKINLTNDNSAF